MRTLIIVVTMVTLASMTGCAGNRDLIVKSSIASRQDVFQEVQATPVLPGKAVLKVEFAVKNFKARFINIYFKHTEPAYTAVLNIDGQITVLSDEPVLEDLPGDFKENPEVGTGWKYNFKKTLLLQPGKHNVSIAVPVSGVIVEKEIDLKEGENILALSPFYYAPVSRYPNYPRFTKGLRGIFVKLNNQEFFPASDPGSVSGGTMTPVPAPPGTVR
jgi:hypothetical protein